MEREKISEFTRKISQCNKSGLTLITYEILFAYIEEAENAHAEGNYDGFKQGIHKASGCLERLMETLNFAYGISKDLYPIYRYCRDELSMALVKKDIRKLDTIEGILRNLYESFAEAAKEDHSQPLMQNSEKVIAGMTYQKNNLTETYAMGDESRGFLV